MTTKSRLNMEHGFMQSIIKNQVDRDNYEREVKAKGGKKVVPPSLTTTKAKKPDSHIYAPPMARSKDCRNNVDDLSASFTGLAMGQPEEKRYLFTFEYEDENGELFHLVVNRGDDTVSLARRFGKERGLNSRLIDALSEFLQEQINKRTLTKGGS